MANAAADAKLKTAIGSFDFEGILTAVKKGANPNLKANSTHALTMACWYLKLDVVRELLARGANPNIDKGHPLRSTVTTTNRGDAGEVLKLLLEHGAKIDTRYSLHQNATAVGVAIETGHPQLAEMLVKAGADLTMKDDGGRTPVKMAKDEGYRKLVELMTGKKSKSAAPARDPFIEQTYIGQITKGKSPHTSGVPDWKKVFKGKHFPGCANPPVHLLTLDLDQIPELPDAIRALGKVPIVSHACECDERDYYEFAIGRDGRLSDTDDDDTQNECERGDYHPSKKATAIRVVRETESESKNCGIIVGGQPRWAQSPHWPSCPKCDEKSFFLACLYQFHLPPSAAGRGNTLNVFVCGKCRTETMIRQST